MRRRFMIAAAVVCFLAAAMMIPASAEEAPSAVQPLIERIVISYAADGTGNADEIVAIQVKKKSDLNEAAATLKTHLETRKTLYAAYDKSQLPKLEKSKVFTRGTLAILMVADDSDKMEAAFNDFFRK